MHRRRFAQGCRDRIDNRLEQANFILLLLEEAFRKRASGCSRNRRSGTKARASAKMRTSPKTRQLSAEPLTYGTRQLENLEKTAGKYLTELRIDAGYARPFRQRENLESAGNALFAAIPANEAVNFASACSYTPMCGSRQ